MQTYISQTSKELSDNSCFPLFDDMSCRVFYIFVVGVHNYQLFARFTCRAEATLESNTLKRTDNTIVSKLKSIDTPRLLEPTQTINKAAFTGRVT